MTSQGRILLVDDETLVLSSLRRLLSRDGFVVSTAASGPEALALLATTEVDLILSDYRMPRMNGVEFLREAAARWPAIHRCLLTAQADRTTLEEALASGICHKAFRKPWDNQELVQSLRDVLGILSE